MSQYPTPCLVGKGQQIKQIILDTRQHIIHIPTAVEPRDQGSRSIHLGPEMLERRVWQPRPISQCRFTLITSLCVYFTQYYQVILLRAQSKQTTKSAQQR